MAMADLIREFAGLAKERQKDLVRVAQERAHAGKCFLCSWITKQERFEDFPRDARVVHLMLDCAGVQ